MLKAKFLADRVNYDHCIRLYTLYDFHIEVFFDNETHLVNQLCMFKQTDNVLSYLKNIEFAV